MPATVSVCFCIADTQTSYGRMAVVCRDPLGKVEAKS